MGAVAGTDFAKHRLRVNLHRRLANVEVPGDFLIRHTLAQTLQNLALPLCQHITKWNGGIFSTVERTRSGNLFLYFSHSICLRSMEIRVMRMINSQLNSTSQLEIIN